MDYSRLSDADLLRKLIGVRQTRKVYQGSLTPLFEGAPEASLERCLVAKELVKRWLGEQLVRAGPLSSPGAVRDYLRLHFRRQEFESFVVLFLDSQNCLLGAEDLFRGTLTQTSVYPREIVKAALRQNAAAVIFAHNHPSGLAEPSKADESLTRSLKQALAVVDVKVLDHFVVGAQAVMSFAERGLL